MLQSFTWSLLPAYAAALASGYLCGSIPFGLILTRLAGTQDIRSIGSGNIGATNVLRTGRKGLAAATLLGDALKGTAAVLAVYWYYGREYQYFADELAIPAALVATYIGILLALAWPVGLAFCLIWLAVAALTRYSSLAALIASALTPFGVWMVGTLPQAVLFALLTALLWIMHRGNISRLINGTEGKIGKPATSDIVHAQPPPVFVLISLHDRERPQQRLALHLFAFLWGHDIWPKGHRLDTS
jgi:glycerol-3-phosphate acyltransferase PlsY